MPFLSFPQKISLLIHVFSKSVVRLIRQATAVPIFLNFAKKRSLAPVGSLSFLCFAPKGNNTVSIAILLDWPRLVWHRSLKYAKNLRTWQMKAQRKLDQLQKLSTGKTRDSIAARCACTYFISRVCRCILNCFYTIGTAFSMRTTTPRKPFDILIFFNKVSWCR